MRHLLWIGSLVTALCLSHVALGAEGDKAAAEKHFKAGLALFKAEKYEAAALELEVSVKLFPTATLGRSGGCSPGPVAAPRAPAGAPRCTARG